jgi:anti-sigma regulatory factor (Ser/Thr protein kinase)
MQVRPPDDARGGGSSGTEATYASRDAPLQVQLDDPQEIGVCRASMRSWLRVQLPQAHVDDVLLAAGEAIDNALEHGVPPIVVAMSWQDHRELVVEINDGGRWVIPARGGDRGFGMPIMTALMDAVSVDTTRGTRLVLRRRFQP